MKEAINPMWARRFVALSQCNGGQLFFTVSIVVVAVLKIYVLAVYGADQLGDYIRLTQFAAAIRSDPSWLWDAGLTQYAIPPTLWKPIGYPLLMVAAQQMLGGSWMWGLIIVHSAFSFAAGFFVRRFVLGLDLGANAATLAFLMYEFSVPASTDVLIMPDSLYGSLTTIVLCTVGGRLLQGRALSVATMSFAGFVMLACFFMREVFFYLIAPLGLAVVVPAMLLNGLSKRCSAILLLAFCLPVLVCAVGVMTWNYYRTGAFLISSGGQTAFLIAALKVAEKTPVVFDGETTFDVVARASLSDYDYGDAQRINEMLFKTYGIEAPELVRLTEHKFRETVARFPYAYLLSVLDRFRFHQQASMCGDVLMRLDDLDWWRHAVNLTSPQSYYSGWRAQAQHFFETKDLRLLDANILLHLAPRVVLRVASLILFLLFTLGLPVLLFYDLRATRGPALSGSVLLSAFYLFYWIAVALHLLVNLETRYLGMVCSIPIIGALLVTVRLAPALSRLGGGFNRLVYSNNAKALDLRRGHHSE